MPNFGRRFTIEPRPQRPAATYPSRLLNPAVATTKRLGSPHRAGDEASKKVFSGIRLVPRSSLIVSRKYGSSRSQLVSDLTQHDMTFTVTECGLEPEAFIRVMYRCPRTTFVQTAWGDEEEGATKQISSLHKTYQFDRESVKALIIRPRVSPAEAALDLETQGLFIQPWFDAEQSHLCLQIAATEAWEVIRAEQLDSHAGQNASPVVLDESSKEFLVAFLRASEKYLDREEYDLLKEQAWGLVKGASKN